MAWLTFNGWHFYFFIFTFILASQEEQHMQNDIFQHLFLSFSIFLECFSLLKTLISLQGLGEIKTFI